MKNLWIAKLSVSRSIKARITILFLLIVLLITAFLSAILYWQCFSMVTKEASDKVSKTVEEASKVIDIDEFVKLQKLEDEKNLPMLE